MTRFLYILSMTLFLMLLAATPALAVQVVNVAVSRVESTQAVLVVQTDVTSDVTVDYGQSPGSYTASASDNGHHRHEVTLDGLAPSSTVYYRVAITHSGHPAETTTLAEKSFHTSRPAGEPFSFVVGGDNRPNSDTTVQPAVWSTIVGQMAAGNPDLALSVGDIIFGLGGDSQSRAEDKYSGYFAVMSRLTEGLPLYLAVGNHEMISSSANRAALEHDFTLPVNNGADSGAYGEEYYSFDNGDTHFISLCTELPGQEGLITGNQKAWLENDLAATGKVWIVVFMHRPLFSGMHATDPWVNPLDAVGQQNKAELHSLFRQYGVDLVFEGHEHFYLHHLEDGVHYVITGGGGAPLMTPLPGPGDIFAAGTYQHVKVDETSSSLAVSSIDYQGNTLESFDLWAFDLGLGLTGSYWASYADYAARNLSADILLSNNDATDLSDIQVEGISATNGVSASTATPMALPDLASGASTGFTIHYSVPAAVSSFSSVVYISCRDQTGALYQFPGPYPF